MTHTSVSQEVTALAQVLLGQLHELIDRLLAIEDSVAHLRVRVDPSWRAAALVADAGDLTGQGRKIACRLFGAHRVHLGVEAA